MARVRGHDHVAYLQGLMLDENRFYLVMSLCTNQSLREFLNENKEAMRHEKDDKKKLQWAKQVRILEKYQILNFNLPKMLDMRRNGLASREESCAHGLGHTKHSSHKPR